MVGEDFSKAQLSGPKASSSANKYPMRKKVPFMGIAFLKLKRSALFFQ